MPLQLRLLVGLLALLALLAARHLHRYQHPTPVSATAPLKLPATGSKQRAADFSKTARQAPQPTSVAGTAPLLVICWP